VPLVTATIVAHVMAGILPIVFVIGLGTALRALAAGSAGLPAWLLVACLAFVGAQAVAPVRLVASQAIARRVDAYCSSRLMTGALTRTDLRTLERPEVADALSDTCEALENMALTPGTATEGALALITRYTQLAGALVLVLVEAGPAAAAAAAAVALVTRRGQAGAFRRWGGLVRGFAPVRRRISYLRELATSTTAAKEIRSLGLLDWIDRRYTEENRAYLTSLWGWRRRVYGAPFVGYTVLGLIGTAAALLLLVTDRSGGGAAHVGQLTIGLQAIVLCAGFGTIFPESDVKLVYGRSAWESLLEFERLCGTAPGEATARAGASAAGASAAGDSAAGASAEGPAEQIRLEDVEFGYEPGRPVLDGISLTIEAGRSTAIVGVNGAGKTTLVKVLTGLYRPAAGRVTCDGRDVADRDPASWQRQFAVMLQDYVRYELTFRENIAMGATGHLDDERGMLADLDRVGLRGLAESMPAGLDTPLTRLTPGGRDISGGQWQRVALARALFAVRHGASVLVLDEPAAQLDARGEAEFYDAFVELTRGVTSIIISHRFSSVRNADKIVVIEGGRIGEAGSHDDLVAADGSYAAMFRAQASRFTRTAELP
jgi:ATP-binding cassette, subfamily B, bacterial